MSSRRNIGIVAHIDAGKTTLTEQILHATGVLRRPGSVEDGSTVSDWQRQEQERGITIGSAAVVCRWGEVELTLIDTPGHVDFSIEVARALTVLDGSVVIISGCDGIQAQTQTVWHQAAQHELPAIGFINKLDRPGYDHEALLVEIRERFGIEPLPLQLPLRFGGSELALLDVLNGTILTWQLVQKKAGVRSPETHPIEDDYHEVMRQVALEHIADAVAAYDDGFAERYLSGDVLSLDCWHHAIQRATFARRVLPLIFGVARSGAGPAQLLNAVTAFLPSPESRELPCVFEASTGAPAGRLDQQCSAAFVFKTERRHGGQRVAHVRVFSGAIEVGDCIQVVSESNTFEVQQLVRLMGSEELEVPRLVAGTVGAIIVPPDGPRLRTGQTLTVEGGEELTFEYLSIPTPVISVSLEADDEAEDQRMRTLLEEAVHDDPSLSLLHDRDTGQTLLAGMGELHLELVMERLQKDEGLRCRIGQPRPRLRTMIDHAVDARLTRTHAGQQRGSVTIELELRPIEQSDIRPVSYQNSPPIEGASRRALEAGVMHALVHEADLVGISPRVCELRLAGGAVNPRMLWDAGHAVATAALGLTTLRPAEPWMSVTIATPEALVGRVSGDLARRRAKILGSESRGVMQLVHLEVPLSEMIHYATALRSLTGGRGTFSMRPSRFRPAPDMKR